MDMTRIQKLSELPTRFQDFVIEVYEKFEKVAFEKNRSLQPWNDCEISF